MLQPNRTLTTGLVLALMLAITCQAAERQHIDLNGRWGFRLDPRNVGQVERWFDSDSFADTITVPGAWQAQGFGERSGMLRNHYAGVAWYRRHVEIPASWNGQLVTLRVGGANRRTRAIVNGVDFGEHDGFSAPFSFDVTGAVRPGGDNIVALRVENPAMAIEASPDKQVASLPTGMLNYIANWGGIYGDVALEAANRTRVDSVLVTSDFGRKSATFRVAVASDVAGSVMVRVSVSGTQSVSPELHVEAGRVAEAAIELPLPNAPPWSPDHPALLLASIQLLRGGNEIDRLEQRFGFRQISTRGNVLLLNGKPIYLRGYGDDNVEVMSGFPPASRKVCLERLRLARSFGFNAVRFHSMTPPQCYFDAADEVGILIMAELPAAYTQYFFGHRDFLGGELERTLLAYRNHPSLLSLAFGNEFNLRWLKTDAQRKIMTDTIADFYGRAKMLAPGTLIMSNDGFDLRPTDMVSLFGRPPGDRPTVRHEFGQYYCSLPDPSLIDEFKGVMAPEWLEQKKKWIAANGLGGLYSDYLRNSVRVQQLGRKFQIERARADGRVTGYHYWLLVDYPGGTGEGDSWEEGWFDYFWRPKVPAEQGRELNSAVLPLIDAGVGDRTLWAGDRKSIGVLVSNYGGDAIDNGVLSWTLTSGGARIDGAELHGIHVPLGDVSRIGEILLRAPADDRARKLELALTIQSGSTSYANRWDFWTFPKQNLLAASTTPVVSNIKWAGLRRVYPWLRQDAGQAEPGALLITDKLNEAARAHLRGGGRVWLMMPHAPDARGITFFPASGGALGTIVRESGALAEFPHDGFCDLQFYNLLNGAMPFPLDAWPSELVPTVGAIRTASEFLSKQKNLSRAGYVFEASAGGGRLLVTSLRIRENFDEAYPEAIYLFDRLLRYASGAGFAPRITVPAELLDRLPAE